MTDITAANETAAKTLRRAAWLIRKRAREATPGPWERPLDVRNKAIVGAALPDDEQPRTWENGTIPDDYNRYGGYQGRYAGQRERVTIVSVPVWSDGSHDRQRSGRDLEYIAAMDPQVGLALAGWLEYEAQLIDADDSGMFDPEMLRKHPLAVARAVLGEGK